MSSPDGDPRAAIERALAGVDPSAPSTTKFNRLEAAFARLLGLTAAEVAAVTVSKAGNLSVRAEQSLHAQHARVLVAVVTKPGEEPAVRRAATMRVKERKDRSTVLLVAQPGGGWAATSAVERLDEPEPLLNRLQLLLGTDVHTVAPAAGGSKPDLFWPPLAPLPGSVAVAPLQIDDRVRRMLRLAVASRPAVMLVGPPGTGKSRLVAELLDDVTRQPGVYGMATGHEVSIVTPDESWTARELVGGDTVDDNGRIRFAPGAVLDALAGDRWLVLDEANRADLDRIFGSLLTWLAGQPVKVGKVSATPGAGDVQLGWADTASSTVDGLERLTEDDPGEDPVQYLAGTEWRLLGTYNALDAQRVFSLGHALGRRFAHVPVPAPTTDLFAAVVDSALDPVPAGLRPAVREAIVNMYSAHHISGAATLGPAAFLEVPRYVGAGAATESSAPLDQLLAEAYLTALGPWLARLEEQDLDRLAGPLSAEDTLGGQWAWVRDQLHALR